MDNFNFAPYETNDHIWGLYFTYLLSFTLFFFTVVSSCIVHYEVGVKFRIIANIATIKLLYKSSHNLKPSGLKTGRDTL